MPEPTETPSPTPSPTPKHESKTEVKLESKKQDKKPEVKPIYPKYQGYSCPVCGSKRVTDDSGKYICPVTPKPSDCPVQ
jgi:rubrerythrin